MYFVGVDLAWSSKNQSGLCIVKGDKNKGELIYLNTHYGLQDMIDTIFSYVGDNKAIIGIDAPVVVPNEEGSRIAEKELNKVFRKYHAGAHPANRRRLSSWTGTIRGEELAHLLEKKGFAQTFLNKPCEKVNRTYEIFPHPAIVALFNRDLILQYKAKQNRTYQIRHSEFKEYQKCLLSLESANPKLIVKDSNILKMSPRRMRGKALKEFEDRLDALMCSYIVYYYWKHPSKCHIFGNLEEGYIITPKKRKNLDKFT